MNTVRVLAIDASSNVCSVALWQGNPGATADLVTRSEVAPRQHIKRLMPLVNEVLKEAGASLAELDALAYGIGPGSFTGLRIAAGFAQGLAFGVNKPLLGVSTLKALALQAAVPGQPDRKVCAALDARMGEIYTGAFRVTAAASPEGSEYPGLARVTALDEERVIPPAELELAAGSYSAIGAGFNYLAQMPASLVERLSPIVADADPNAREIAMLAVSQWLAGEARPPEQVQPVYLRDNVARRSTRGPLG